ncbi:MAG TPA: hypothetical protein ENK91_07030 [Bacteroidetes bacterium]|jgi:uridine kinase|nr:hypothetical protein [Bacteroidota bacterium]
MIIGIGGVSRAGKTTLAKKIANYYSGMKKVILHQDDYINAGFDIPQIKNRIDWEVPESIDFPRLKYDLIWLKEHVDLVILEGIFSFFDHEINKMYDKKIFVDLGYKDFINRKLLDKRWGYEPLWYIYHIWDSYKNHREDIIGIKDILILEDNTENSDKKVIEFLQS